MTLIHAYGVNGKIFSVWRCSPHRRTFQFHKGDRAVCRVEARPRGTERPYLDFKARRALDGHQPLIDAIEKHLTETDNPKPT